MAFFTQDELDFLSEKSCVRYAVLAHLKFKTAPETRIFAGSGTMLAAGYSWSGVGEMIKIDGLSEQRGTDSAPVTFTLSGVDQKLLPVALSDTSEVDQQPLSLFMQLLDENEQPVGRLLTLFHGLMQPPKISKTYSEDSGWLCTIELTAENLLAGKAKPPFGRYTDRDQQMRHPGDRFFERVYTLNGKTVTWPNY